MIFDKETAHIVYASDDKFSEIMGISLISMFENSKDMKQIIVHILDSGISAENKVKLESICERYNRNAPVWITAKNISQELKIDVSVDRGSLSQYARLFISSVLSEEIERVIYLDCDIIINKSIRELWNMDMHGKTIAALKDAFSSHYRANINLKPDDIMFNSGVMLVDLNMWKKQNVEGRLLSFISAKQGKIQQGDQGALNAVLSRDTYCFEPRFNSVTIFYDFNYEEMMIYRKPPDFYSKEQIRDAVENPVIIHFTTSFLSKRPWIKGCKHKYVGEWIKYKSISPWADTELWDDNSSPFKKITMKFFEMLPRKFAIHFAGVMQAYARPFINKLTKS